MSDILIPSSLINSMNMSSERLRVEIAMYLYDKGGMSMGQARKFACLSQLDFQKELKKHNILVKYEQSDLDIDLQTISGV